MHSSIASKPMCRAGVIAGAVAAALLMGAGSAGLVERIPHSRRYRLVGAGYSICVAFLNLFEKVYAPLTAGLLAPFSGDHALPEEKRCELDRL